MTAAKELEIISSPPGCARQAADAVSAHTQVKMEDLFKNRSQNVQIFGYVYQNTNVPNMCIWVALKENVTH